MTSISAAMALCALLGVAGAAVPRGVLDNARTLYDKGMYEEAARLLAPVRGSEAEGLRTLCLVKGKSRGWEDAARAYELNYPESGLIPAIHYNCGLNLFDESRFAEAMPLLEEIPSYRLRPQEAAEQAFKLGYSLYSVGDRDGAGYEFGRIEKMQRSDYTVPGRKMMELLSRRGKLPAVELSGGADKVRGRKLYLRGSLGYRLNPEAEAVYYPLLKSGYALGTFARSRSYVGGYQSPEGRSWNGYESLNSAGIAARKTFSGSVLGFEAAYGGTFTRSGELPSGKVNTAMNSVSGALSISGNGSGRWIYGARAFSRYGRDRVTGLDDLSFLRLDLDARLGYRYDDHVLMLLVQAGNTRLSGLAKGSVADFSIRPGYIRESHGFRLSLGVNIAGSDKSYHKNQFIYPDIRIDRELVAGHLGMWLKAKGGNTVLSYLLMKVGDPFYRADMGGVGGNSVERFDVGFGLGGNIAGVLRFSLEGGFRLVDDNPLYATSSQMPRFIAKCKTDEAYFKGELVYDSRPLEIEVFWQLRNVSLCDDPRDGIAVFLPRPLKMGFKAMYSWKSRMRFGLDAEFLCRTRFAVADSYEGDAPFVPACLDLGLYAEYSLDRRMTVYARGGNLLDRKIFRDNMMTSGGAYVSAGLMFSL